MIIHNKVVKINNENCLNLKDHFMLYNKLKEKIDIEYNNFIEIVKDKYDLSKNHYTHYFDIRKAKDLFVIDVYNVTPFGNGLIKRGNTVERMIINVENISN